jgi:uncharacterized protein YpmB
MIIIIIIIITIIIIIIIIIYIYHYHQCTSEYCATNIRQKERKQLTIQVLCTQRDCESGLLLQ